MAVDLGILRTVVCDGEDLTSEAEHTVGLEAAQPPSIVLKRKDGDRKWPPFLQGLVYPRLHLYSF